MDCSFGVLHAVANFTSKALGIPVLFLLGLIIKGGGNDVPRLSNRIFDPTDDLGIIVDAFEELLTSDRMRCEHRPCLSNMIISSTLGGNIPRAS